MNTPILSSTPRYASTCTCSLNIEPTQHALPSPSLLSIILTQPIETRQTARAIKIPIPNLLRQYPRRHPLLPIPLCRALRRPGPVKPSPSGFKRAHLRLCIRHKPTFVRIAIATGIRIRRIARASAALGRAAGCEDGWRAIGAVEGAFPACASVDVVEVGGTVCIGLGPFTAECGTEAMSSNQYSLLQTYHLTKEEGDAHPVVLSELCFICPVHPVHAYPAFAV